MAQLNLRALESLKDYPDAELKLLMSVVAAREYAEGGVLCQEGTPGHSCFLVASGAVQVIKKDQDGPRTLTTLGPGAMVGQMALVDRAPRSATVVATQPTVALELSRDVFEKLLAAASPLALRFQEQIAIAGIRQLRAATERLEALLADPDDPAMSLEDRNHLLTIQAALQMWDLSVEDLDAVEVSVPAGQMTHAELKSRLKNLR